MLHTDNVSAHVTTCGKPPQLSSLRGPGSSACCAATTASSSSGRRRPHLGVCTPWRRLSAQGTCGPRCCAGPQAPHRAVRRHWTQVPRIRAASQQVRPRQRLQHRGAGRHSGCWRHTVPERGSSRRSRGRRSCTRWRRRRCKHIPWLRRLWWERRLGGSQWCAPCRGHQVGSRGSSRRQRCSSSCHPDRCAERR